MVRQIPHSRASALALCALSLSVTISPTLPIQWLSTRIRTVRSLNIFLYHTVIGHPILLSPKAACERVDFHLGEIALRHNENLRKAFSFAESFIPYGSIVHFYAYRALKHSLGRIKTKRIFSALYRRPGAPKKRKQTRCANCSCVRVAAIKVVVSKNRLSNAGVSASATFTVFGRSTNSLLLFCSSNDGRSSDDGKKENKNLFEVWLSWPKYICLANSAELCAYVIKIHGDSSTDVFFRICNQLVCVHSIAEFADEKPN